LCEALTDLQILSPFVVSVPVEQSVPLRIFKSRGLVGVSVEKMTHLLKMNISECIFYSPGFSKVGPVCHDRGCHCGLLLGEGGLGEVVPHAGDEGRAKHKGELGAVRGGRFRLK
jgi:hypothetical protein